MSLREQIHEDFIVDYSVKLGSGAFGDVFRGIWKSKNTFVAVKRIKDSITNAKEMMDEEVKVMNNLKHQNVLNFLAVIKSQKGTFLVIEFCEGGGLEKEIEQGIPELNCYLFLKQIVDGMCAVNKALHIHRDLKPENILFTKDKILKLCDFGLARRVMGDDPNKIQRFSAKGTPLYACPQILRREEYGARCDVWSTGVILVQMLTAKNPFSAATNFNTLKKLQQKLLQTKNRYVLQGNYSDWFKNIVSKMLAYYQQDRWTFYQLKEEIDANENLFTKQYGTFSSFDTTKITQQNLGEGATTFVDVPESNTIRKIKVVSQEPYNSVNGNGKGENINEIQQRLLTREENKKLLGQLKLYVEYIYNRGKMFSDIVGKHYQSPQNLKSKSVKLLLLFLSIGVFLKNIDKVMDIIIRRSQVTLPNGTTINYKALDEKSMNNFKSVQKDYQSQMNNQTNKFKGTIDQIYTKINSKQYTERYPQLLSKYPHILKLLQNLKNDCCQKPVEYYQNCFNEFFRNECLEKGFESMSEEFIRGYWRCLNLIDINKVLPRGEFENIFIMPALIEKFKRLPLQEMKKLISSAHK